MNPFSHSSVRRKLVWLILLGSALTLLCVVLAVVLYEFRTFQPRALEQLRAEADVLEEVLAAPLDFGLRESAEKCLARHCSDRRLVLAALYDTRTLFAVWPRQGNSALVLPPPGRPGHEFQGRQLSLWWPVRNSENALIGYLYLVQSLPPLHARLPEYAIMTGAVLLALAVVGLVLMRGLRHHILRPLASLVETTTRVTRHKDYTVRARIHREDELGHLASAFNQMLEAVSQRDAELLRQTELLRHSEAEFRGIVETTREWIWAMDSEGNHTYCNPAVEQMLGYPVAEFMRLDLSLLHPEDRPQVERRLPGLVQSRQGWSQWVLRWRHRDGSYRWLESNAVPVFDTLGCLTGFQGADRDITERKRVEQALRESEEKFRALFENASDAIFLLEKDRFIDCNARSLEMFGAETRDQIVGHTPAEFSPPLQPGGQDSRGVAVEKITAAQSGHPQFFEWTHTRLDDTPFPAEVSLNRVELSGRMLLQAIVRDITERKKVEEALRASLDEKSILLQEVHHRVKNNLQIVCSLLNLQTVRTHNPEALATLRETGDRVRSMALLHETLYRSGNVARVDFAGYIESVCAHLFRSHGTKAAGIQLERRLAEASLELDQAVACGLIINELVSNALKHAFPNGRSGRIVVEMKTLEGGRIALTVADDGVGLPPALDLRKTETLGHRLVSMLAEKLDGTVEVSRHAGTRIQITFHSRHG